MVLKCLNGTVQTVTLQFLCFYLGSFKWPQISLKQSVLRSQQAKISLQPGLCFMTNISWISIVIALTWPCRLEGIRFPIDLIYSVSFEKYGPLLLSLPPIASIRNNINMLHFMGKYIPELFPEFCKISKHYKHFSTDISQFHKRKRRKEKNRKNGQVGKER